MSIADVRRFNRTVTEHIGVLQDHYLGRSLTLGQARVLWEIGPAGCELRMLRARLGLDAGYLTRIVGGLERSGLVTIGSSPADRRTRMARLTTKGMGERASLEHRSDELARSLLGALNEEQQEQLSAAMRGVERLLTRSALEVRGVDPGHTDARRCLAAYYAELGARSGAPFDPDTGSTAHPHEVRPPRGVFLVAYLRGTAMGCGALKHHDGGVSDIKRMWVHDGARGRGVGRRLLEQLEQSAAEHGDRVIRLETSRLLTEAIGLYTSAGYVEVDPFNDEAFADHWFQKVL